MQILQSQAGPSSGLGFYSEMSVHYPPLHVSEPGTIQAGLLGMGTSTHALRRTISSHMTGLSGGNKDSISKVTLITNCVLLSANYEPVIFSLYLFPC